MRNIKYVIGWVVTCLLAFTFAASGGITQLAYSIIQDEGTPQIRGNTINFTGAGVTCGPTVSLVTPCDIPGSSGSGYSTIQEEGKSLTQRTTLNFTGAGITCADNAGKSTTDCDVPGGGGGGGGATRGTFAAIPTCDMTTNGQTYWTTDSGLQAQCDGTSWQYFFGQFPVTPLTTTTVNTWYNQTSATLTGVPGGVILTSTTSGSANIQGRLTAVPATPYT